jgi:hypothetical protein
LARRAETTSIKVITLRSNPVRHARRRHQDRAMLSATSRAPAMAENGRWNKDRLRVRRVIDVPLREVSGICLRRSRNGRMFLIAVGDRV